MAISTSFSTAITGLHAHQLAMDVTSNNVSNASNKDYVRERAVFSTYSPINAIPGDIGTGVKIDKVYRITDTFLFSRYSKASSDMQNLTTKENYLQEIATYFPDVNDEGLYKDLEDFFNAWQTFASNPNDSSVKVDLAYKTEALTDTIHTLRAKLKDIQKNINDEVETKVNEANTIIKEIADLNHQITAHEANGASIANELRDKRDALEKRLQEILNVDIYKTGTKSIDAQGNVSVDFSEKHSISIGGVTILDDSTYNELKLVEKDGNHTISVENQDFSLTDVTKSITKGEIGALFDVRGREFGKDGEPVDGTIGELISSLDSLSQGIIRSVNSIYSYSAQPFVATDAVVDSISVSPEMAKTPLSLLTDKLYNPVK
ncbi:MAG: flagellar hook-associated protein FlgK, partial [Epsilonproteobacteria bacterium]|nr:flagellar hook-associated protein FlgK [Campylobacterota bacterium]